MRLQYIHLTVMENLKKETSGKPAGTTSLKWSPGNRGELQKYRQSRTAWGPFENDGHAVCRDSRRISLAYPVTNYPHSGQSKSPIRLLCGKMEGKDSGSKPFQQIPAGNLWLILLEMLPQKSLSSVNSLPHFDTVCQINRPEKVENQLKPLRQTQNILIYRLLKEWVQNVQNAWTLLSLGDSGSPSICQLGLLKMSPPQDRPSICWNIFSAKQSTFQPRWQCEQIIQDKM